MSGQLGHMRFTGAIVYCPTAGKRVHLDPEHEYGQEFICPGCYRRVEATDYYKEKSARA